MAILRILALIAFVIAAAIAGIDDQADVLDIFTALSVGLALWVGSTLVADR